MRIIYRVGAIFLVLLCGASLARAADATQRPNVLFILADDLGWADTQPYGSTFYETPNLTRLAARGVRFTNAYAANPLCSPTRSSILTGLYPGRLGITTPSCHLPEVRLKATIEENPPARRKAAVPVSVTRLETSYPTLSQALKNAGYATAHFGKWHLGREPYSPLQQGFDVDLPHWYGPGPSRSYLAPWSFWKDQGKPGEHIEDRMAKEATAFITAHKDQPFFVNYWAFSVHSPWTAKPELVEHFKKKAASLPSGAGQRNPVYAAMVKSLDDAVGTLLDTLDRLKIADNTVIVFFSDNGGVNWYDDKMKPFGFEIPVTSNAPLRGGKASLWEGGTREPCLVVWPGRTRPGSVSEALLSSVDWLPTLLEVTGVKPKPGQPFDGVSQVPALLGTGQPRDTAYCFFPHYGQSQSAPGVWVRKGDWKLIRFFFDADDRSDRFELYDLKNDIGETRNLVGERPDKVKELAGLIEAHLKDINPLLPVKNPAYKATAASGWTSNEGTELAVVSNELLIKGDAPPRLVARGVAAEGGPFVLELRLKSSGSGNGRVFWAGRKQQPIFAADRAVPLRPMHDGEWHEYTVNLAAEVVDSVRIDPGSSAKSLSLAWVRLRNREGNLVKEWTFGPQAGQRKP